MGTQPEPHLYHLPPIPDNLTYRVRKFTDAPGNPPGIYLTTGAFDLTATDGTLKNLRLAPMLVLDCDLADYYQNPALKDTFHALPDPELDQYLQAQLATVLHYFAEATAGLTPTYVFTSGYGLHVYLWHDSPAEIASVRATNKALIERVNTAAGYKLADTNAADTGTRVFRAPGTLNHKAPTPRLVKPLYHSGTVAQLAALPCYTQATRTPQHTPNLSATTTNAAALTASIPGPLAQAFTEANKDAEDGTHSLFTKCPFFLWATENPTEVSYQSWRALAVNLAAVAGEYGRAHFHALSRLDTKRYDAHTTDTAYTHALQSATDYGPTTYETIASFGDWTPETLPPYKAPAVLPYAIKPDTQTDVLTQITVNVKTGTPLKTHGNARKIVRADKELSSLLRFNDMTLQIEHKGEAIRDDFAGYALEYIEDKYSVSFSRMMIADVLLEIAQENAYHPVADWLNTLHYEGTSRIDECLTDVLGVPATELHREYLRRFLISAVARGLCTDPVGVKVDSVLILKGEQGARKSTFFRTLAGDRFFSDSPVIPNTKDAFIALRGTWLLEWGEFEHTLGKVAVQQTKAFLSSQVDSFRLPYGRNLVKFPRRSVIVGSTNEDHFLFDPTGSRRFWIISIPGQINTDKLVEIRTQLWAEAVQAYRNGERHWLESDLDAVRAEEASAYSLEEPWESVISEWVEGKNGVTLEEILASAVQKDPKDWKRGDYQTAGAILRKLGYVRKRVRVGDRRLYRYYLRGTLDAAGMPENVIEFPQAGTAARDARTGLTPGEQTAALHREFLGAEAHKRG